MFHILIFMAALQPAFAKFSSTECERILAQTEVTQPAKAPSFDRGLVIGTAEMAFVENSARIDQLSHPELLKKAFDVYVQARLKNVSPVRRDRANKALARVSNRVTGDSGGTYWSDVNEIGISVKVPTDSVVYYRFVVHELEHALQNFGAVAELTWLVRNWSSRKKYGKTKDEWWPWYSYHKELEAVRAEYDFLRLLPEAAMLGDSYGEFDQTETVWFYARSGDFKRFHELSSYSSIYAVKRAYQQ
jgi:hypothetical protein